MDNRAWLARRRWIDLVLVPAAIVIVLWEDVIWAGARSVLRGLRAFAPIRAVERGLGRLPGYAALPMFLVPEILGRVGELWAIALLVRGHVHSGVTVYVLVRLLSALLAVFIYHACEAALMRIAWFARVVGWVRAARAWSLVRVAPIRARMRTFVAATPGRVARRLASWRIWLGRKLSRLLGQIS